MRQLELTLSGRYVCHAKHLLTYKLRYKDCGYGMFLLDTKTGYWYPTTAPLESLNRKVRKNSLVSFLGHGGTSVKILISVESPRPRTRDSGH